MAGANSQRVAFCFSGTARQKQRLSPIKQESLSPASSPVSAFIQNHYRHFNAATLKDAAEGYRKHLDDGGLMFTLGNMFITGPNRTGDIEHILVLGAHGPRRLTVFCC